MSGNDDSIITKDKILTGVDIASNFVPGGPAVGAGIGMLRTQEENAKALEEMSNVAADAPRDGTAFQLVAEKAAYDYLKGTGLTLSSLGGGAAGAVVGAAVIGAEAVTIPVVGPIIAAVGGVGALGGGIIGGAGANYLAEKYLFTESVDLVTFFRTIQEKAAAHQLQPEEAYVAMMMSDRKQTESMVQAIHVLQEQTNTPGPEINNLGDVLKALEDTQSQSHGLITQAMYLHNEELATLSGVNSALFPGPVAQVLADETNAGNVQALQLTNDRQMVSSAMAQANILQLNAMQKQANQSPPDKNTLPSLGQQNMAPQSQLAAAQPQAYDVPDSDYQYPPTMQPVDGNPIPFPGGAPLATGGGKTGGKTGKRAA